MKKVLEEALRRFSEQVEEKRFFQAHETLEELWFPIRREKERWQVSALKGMINGAVALELARKGRVEASERVWERYRSLRMEVYPEADPAFARANKALEEAWVKRPSD